MMVYNQLLLFIIDESDLNEEDLQFIIHFIPHIIDIKSIQFISILIISLYF